MSNELLNHALRYAEFGLDVLPLAVRGKRPLSPHGKDDATRDIDQVRAWWTRWPQANLGVRPPEGLVVLDVDPRNGGENTLAALQVRHGGLPDTLTCQTGSGGRHIWLGYRGPTRGQLGAGVDIKTHTGYLVMPPSVHPHGEQYRWLNQAKVASAPGWLRRLLAPPKITPRVHSSVSAATGVSALVRTVSEAGEGNRNRCLYWAACRVAESGGDGEQYAALLDAATAAGLDDSEARRTIVSAARTTAEVIV